MAAFATIVSLAGTAVSAIGMYAQGQAEGAAMDAQADARRRRAMEERAVASIRADRQSQASRRLMSIQRAGYAASGGGMDGSAGVVMGETGRRGLHNARLEQWQGEQRGRGLEDQANIDEFSADQRRTAGLLGAGGAILTGVSRVGARDGWFESRGADDDEGTGTGRRRYYG